ncbi:MAG: Fibronectin type domain protein, partial [Labilithrix sp.]|nr:Fibronectin type domain protein [Labilithrix sp.]
MPLPFRAGSTFALAAVLTAAASCESPAITPFGSAPRANVTEDGDAGFGWVRPPSGSHESVARTPVDAGPEPLDLRTPSGFLLISKERLELLRTRGRYAGGAALDALRENVAEAGSALERDSSGVENVALLYLITQEKRHADLAWRWFKLMSKDNVRGDSYLGFGDLMRGAAVVLNWCGAALTPEQQREIAEYLERWTHELWFDNKGTGWALSDPGNNYYYSFVEGTSYAAYALKAANRPGAQKLVDLALSKIEGPNGSLAYFEKGGRGGDWEEGSNYGLGSKRRMFSAFAAIASMGGPNYFQRSAFPNASLLYAAYQIQPGRRVLAPMGDIAREPTLSTSAFDREYVQLATYWSEDAIARGIGAWILKDVVPSYVGETASLRWLFYRDVIYPPPRAILRPNELPLHYRSPGTDWINARSGWDDSATSLTFNATAKIEQSHAHFDTGAFLLYRNGWQAVDGASYGHSGLNWESGAHNMITVKGQVRHGERSRGLVHYADDGKTTYAQIDASKLFTVKRGGVGEPEVVLDEWTRELVYIRPSSLLVYDRVVP